MRENTPKERRKIAEKINYKRNKPQWINSVDELIEQYREYAKRDLMARYEYDNVSDEDKVAIEKIADLYADMATDSFEHDFPALLFLFRRYLTQH